MNPKAFISYSWTSPEHEEWVLTLATELREVGVDVSLDKWDLREGHDAIAFMEQKLTQSDISKVILVCDHKYAEKTNGRAGGVGTEAQIISPAIYAKSDQNKFVAVIAEVGPDGRPYLPTYYQSRIYIDLSRSEIYPENFERLIRWIYDKPIHIKPPLGTLPSFLVEQDRPPLGNSALHRRALDAVRNGKAFSNGAVNEYLQSVVEGLELFRINGGSDIFDEKFMQSIENFLPHRAQLVELFDVLTQYQNTADTRQSVHRCFERMIPYLDVPSTATAYRDWDFDNYRFIVHELFLYLIAILLRNEAFEFAGHMLRQPYYVSDSRRSGSQVRSFSVFYRHIGVLEHRNDRLKLNRLSLRSDLLQQRSHASGVSFQHLMQADFFLFLRGCLDQNRSTIGGQWWPDTLLYCREFAGPVEVFARACSRSYLDKLFPALDISSKEELATVLEGLRTQRLYTPNWGFNSVNSSQLMGFDKLATTP